MNTLRYYLFAMRWYYHNRTWLPTRQKYKAFDKDYARYCEGKPTMHL